MKIKIFLSQKMHDFLDGLVCACTVLGVCVGTGLFIEIFV